MAKQSLIAVAIIFLFSFPAFPQTLILPHMADGRVGDGSRWSTEIDLVNTTASEQSVKISFFNQDGSNRTLAFPGFGGPPSDLGVFFFKTFTLSPNSMIVMETDGGTDPVRDTQKAGWVLVEGSGGIKAALVFRRQDSSGNIISQAGILPQEASATINLIPLVSSTPAEFIFGRGRLPRMVGFALANPDSVSAASGEIQLIRGSSGQLVATSPFTLSPRGQLAQFAQERFEVLKTSNADFYLRVRVTTGTVSAVALSTVGDLISTIPGN